MNELFFFIHSFTVAAMQVNAAKSCNQKISSCLFSWFRPVVSCSLIMRMGLSVMQLTDYMMSCPRCVYINIFYKIEGKWSRSSVTQCVLDLSQAAGPDSRLLPERSSKRSVV